MFAADKLSKARELARLIDEDPQPGAAAGTERARHLTHDQRSVALLQERLPGSPMVDELTEVLGAAGLSGQRPRPARSRPTRSRRAHARAS